MVPWKAGDMGRRAVGSVVVSSHHTSTLCILASTLYRYMYALDETPPRSRVDPRRVNLQCSRYGPIQESGLARAEAAR